MPIIGDFTASSERINDAKSVEVLAGDQIRIGDTVYTIENGQDLKDEFHFPFLDGTDVCAAAFSPDGTKLVLGGDFYGTAKLYSVSGDTVTYVSDIYADAGTTVLDGYNVLTAAFSPDGTKLVLGGEFSGYAKLYSVSANAVTFVSDIAELDGAVETAAFSPNGANLVLGGYFAGFAKFYSVSGDTVTFVDNIYADADYTELDSDACAAAFSPDGTKLVLGGYFTEFAKFYSVSGDTVTFVDNIYANVTAPMMPPEPFWFYVFAVTFSLDGTKLVLGGGLDEEFGYAKLYSVSADAITFVSDIYADTESTVWEWAGEVHSATFSPDGTKLVLGGGKYYTDECCYARLYSVAENAAAYVGDICMEYIGARVNTAAFSPDGAKLVLGGGFAGHAKLFSVSGSSVSFISMICKNNAGTTALDSTVGTATFSPDGTKLVLGGYFSASAKYYSVSGNTVTFVSDIYADAGTALLGSVRTVAFSPDGTKLVLGGDFSGYAKIYSVSESAVAFVSDIYADAGTTRLYSYVNTAAFSPDGTKLVLGGHFTGRAKLYSVSGITVTFISDIYANVGATALGSYVDTAVFSPDGTKLVLGGDFSGRAKIYAVSGNTITYISDIYANVGTTALNSYVNTAAFSPDGTKLVLGGDFSGRAKIYAVSGNTITYISDINDGTGGTVSAVSFSPDGTKLVLGMSSYIGAKLYSISGNDVTYIGRFYTDPGTTFLPYVSAITFSPDGTKLVFGGRTEYLIREGSGYARLYFFYQPGSVYYDVLAYPAENDVINTTVPIDIGYAKENINAGTIGTVRTIAHFDPTEVI